MYAKGKETPPSFLLRAVDELARMMQLHIGSAENAPKELHTGEVSAKQHLISTSFSFGSEIQSEFCKHGKCTNTEHLFPPPPPSCQFRQCVYGVVLMEV